MKKIIAFDLDGTLFTNEKKISKKTKEILERLGRQGYILVPSTGRPYSGLMDVMKLEGIEYCIVNNGAGVYSFKEGQCLHRNAMPLEKFLPVFKQLEEMDVMADAFVDKYAYMTKSKNYLIDRLDANEETKNYIRKTRKIVDNQYETLKQLGKDVEKLTINFPVDENKKRLGYEKVMDLLGKYPYMHAVPGGMRNIEVTASGISKATGLRWLVGKLGLTMEDIMAFGDSGNDREMLEEAGLGIAVANAEIEAREAADKISKYSNEEECIEKELYDYYFKEGE